MATLKRFLVLATSVATACISLVSIAKELHVPDTQGHRTTMTLPQTAVSTSDLTSRGVVGGEAMMQVHQNDLRGYRTAAALTDSAILMSNSSTREAGGGGFRSTSLLSPSMGSQHDAIGGSADDVGLVPMQVIEQYMLRHSVDAMRADPHNRTFVRGVMSCPHRAGRFR